MCSISEGGLGSRRLITFNNPFKGKWLWCYANQRDSIWRVVVDMKYGSLWVAI